MTSALPKAGGINDQDYLDIKAILTIESMINYCESEKIKRK